MAITKPCIIAKMGSTTYYQTTMTGRELASTVRPARESDDWASASIEERMQRDFNMKRIRGTIVPYLAKHPDRFFGSLIVLAPPKSLHFEPLNKMSGDIPAAYQVATRNIGFVTIDKGELIALDGQHRLLAFREVVTSGENLGPFQSEVGDDEVCVLLMECSDERKVRRIFNKVNRHAKPTGRSDNIITSEDDGNAIVTRRLMDRDLQAPLAAREINGDVQEIVNWTSNTLTKRSTKLTTISVVYESVVDILNLTGFENFDERDDPVSPEETRLEGAYQVAAEWRTELLKLDALKWAIENPSELPEIRHSSSDPRALLLRPVGQIALVKGLIRALSRSEGAVTLPELISRANKLDWSASSSNYWRDSIVRGDGRMVARKEAYELAAELFAYLVASEFMTTNMKDELWTAWNAARGRDVKTPVDQIEDESLIPDELPDPLDE